MECVDTKQDQASQFRRNYKQFLWLATRSQACIHENSIKLSRRKMNGDKWRPVSPSRARCFPRCVTQHSVWSGENLLKCYQLRKTWELRRTGTLLVSETDVKLLIKTKGLEENINKVVLGWVKSAAIYFSVEADEDQINEREMFLFVLFWEDLVLFFSLRLRSPHRSLSVLLFILSPGFSRSSEMSMRSSTS